MLRGVTIVAPAVSLATAIECIEAAGLAVDGRERRELLDLAVKHVRAVLAEYTPVQPIVPREALRKSSAHLRAVGVALTEGRVAAGLTPPRGTPGEVAGLEPDESGGGGAGGGRKVRA